MKIIYIHYIFRESTICKKLTTFLHIELPVVPEAGALQSDSYAYVVYPDEANFTHEGMFSLINTHRWETENPQETHPHAQRSISEKETFLCECLLGYYEIFPHNPKFSYHRVGITHIIVFSWKRIYQNCCNIS